MSEQHPPEAVPMNQPGTPQAKSVRWWLSRLMPAGQLLAAGILLIFLVGVAQRAGWIQGEHLATTATSAGSKSDVYTCPMHPQIRQPSPGRCPICGMPLVPATAGIANLDELAITIQPAQRRLANIQTAEVKNVPVTMTTHTIGAIQIDESRQATIASYIDGRVERLFADYTGVLVAKGDHLAVVYSPQLYSAQVEYIEARTTLGKMSGVALAAVREAHTKLVANTRQKLIELGVTEEQIAELEASGQAKSRLTIYAPMGGTVIEKMAVEGEYISAGKPIYRIASLSTVWLMLELFPEDASRIRFGQLVTAELTSLPGQKFTGRVAFIDPTVDKSKRTVGVRVEFDNEAGTLRPGDYAEATIEIPLGPQGEVYDKGLAGKWISPMHPQVIRDEPGDCPICGMKLVPTSSYGYAEQPVDQKSSLVIPRSAVLLAGNSSVVYVEEKPGRFEIRSITLGLMLRERVVIMSGVKEGEKVATAGNFLIDSQMQLAGKPSLIDPARAIAAQQERKTPLELAKIDPTSVEGAAGEQLEQLYATYFQIQASLAKDQKPQEKDALKLHELAATLAKSSSLSDAAHEQLQAITTHSEHLHHLSLEDARLKAFRPLSHAVVQLAAQVRGKAANSPLFHVFCPMVKGGAGDWLQNVAAVHNPYYGSEMLECGEVKHRLPPATPDKVPLPQSPDATKTDSPAPGEQ